MTLILHKIQNRIRQRRPLLPLDQRWKADRAIASLNTARSPGFFECEAPAQGLAEDLDALTAELKKIPNITFTPEASK